MRDYHNLRFLASNVAIEISLKISGEKIDYNPINELLEIIKDYKNNFELKNAIYEAITGIDVRRVNCEIFRGRKTIDEAVKEQNPKLYRTKKEELAPQIALGVKELESIDSLPKERLENLKDFCCELSNAFLRIPSCGHRSLFAA